MSEPLGQGLGGLGEWVKAPRLQPGRLHQGSVRQPHQCGMAVMRMLWEAMG